MTIAVGEIKKAKELGYTSRNKYIYLACEKCQKPRWIRLIGDSPVSKLCKHCSDQSKMANQNGENNPCWNGGKMVTQRGYVKVRKPNHPQADSRGYICEHRLVMESIVGRYLLPNEIVHHIDGNLCNNEPSNLMLLKSQTYHLYYHQLKRKSTSCKKCGGFLIFDYDEIFCLSCSALHDVKGELLKLRDPIAEGINLRMDNKNFDDRLGGHHNYRRTIRSRSW